MSLSWTCHATDGAARLGTLHTAHGDVPTPVFMPVGTAGTVKAMTADAVRATGARLVGLPSAAALAVNAHRYQAVGVARRGTFYYTAVEDGRCVIGPELLEDHAGLQARLTVRADWPVFAVESLPEGMTVDVPVALPSAKWLLKMPAAAHVLPPLEPIYLRPVAFTLPTAR